ncbi:unnamed protein product [Eruca vesicaria subsp. sativa]|uniref:Methyltransferase n=1 Tax=Eruca vesicaria subsp. sativa TaxID=29727 RepID=A0ABC8KJ35_ERUVS|nr:unnamed protein product [Eruca vesicaria subsp. sativa]
MNYGVMNLEEAYAHDGSKTRQLDSFVSARQDSYSARKPGVGPSVCSKAHDVESPFYKPLQMCLCGTRSRRWIPIVGRTRWPSRSSLGGGWRRCSELDTRRKRLLRPGDEDPSPPYNMLGNVLDMNAQFGWLNSALLEAKKSVWLMNVVPTAGPNHLPMILDRGFIRVLHDW